MLRIKTEHPDDNKCIVNDRVKGRLKVTRAFGAGYLKQVTQDQRKREREMSGEKMTIGSP